LNAYSSALRLTWCTNVGFGCDLFAIVNVQQAGDMARFRYDQVSNTLLLEPPLYDLVGKQLSEMGHKVRSAVQRRSVEQPFASQSPNVSQSYGVKPRATSCQPIL
jgi:hypothetical protein